VYIIFVDKIRDDTYLFLHPILESELNRTMSISKFDKCVVIEEKVIIGRREQFYKIINETIDEPHKERLIFTTLHHIAFCDYLLGTEVKENHRLKSILTIVNRKKSTDYTLSDFHISF